MSVYYDYYLAYSKKSKLFPLGPFDKNQKLKAVISKSQSFVSPLHERFDACPASKLGPELKEFFTYKGWDGKSTVGNLKYLRLSDLPKGSILRKGYFLIDDIERYEKEETNYVDDLFYEWLTPTAYAAKAANEARFGKPEAKYDCEGNPFPNYSAGDYAYYAYVDHQTEEFEAYQLREMASLFTEYDEEIKPEEVYVILSIG